MSSSPVVTWMKIIRDVEGHLKRRAPRFLASHLTLPEHVVEDIAVMIVVGITCIIEAREREILRASRKVSHTKSMRT